MTPDPLEDLVPWLRAQLDEDKRIARAACWDEQSDVWTTRPPQGPYERYTVVDYLDDGVVVVTPENADDDGVGQHVAEWDPRRVLREIDAKRQVLIARENASKALSAAEPGTTVHDLMTGAVNSYNHVIQLHAAAYDGRPGYREEWRP